MKKLTKSIAMIVLFSLLMLMLSSCGSVQDTAAVSSQPVSTDVLSAQSEPENLQAADSSPSQAGPEIMPVTESGSDAGRQDDERFEDVIMLEGMEETVRYEHVINTAIGIELDYDYENFERRSDSAGECFISRYDNADAPENYLEIHFSEEDAESAADTIAEVLSQSYNIFRETRTLSGAGACASIDASVDKNNQTPDHLQAVYVIPLSNGCVIAVMHFSFEAADGFGRRFNEILNTLRVMAGR